MKQFVRTGSTFGRLNKEIVKTYSILHHEVNENTAIAEGKNDWWLKSYGDGGIDEGILVDVKRFQKSEYTLEQVQNIGEEK